MCKIFMTDHSNERMKERMGLNKKAAAREAAKAHEHGLTVDDLDGPLARHIEASDCHSDDDCRSKIYHNWVYVFSECPERDEAVLVTVYELKRKYHSRATTVERRKNNQPKADGIDRSWYSEDEFDLTWYQSNAAVTGAAEASAGRPSPNSAVIKNEKPRMKHHRRAARPTALRELKDEAWQASIDEAMQA